MSAETPNALVADPAAMPVYAAGEARRLTLDLNGRLQVLSTFGGGSFTIAGATTPADSVVNPTNAVTTYALGGVWNRTTSRWERTTGIIPGDAVSNPAVAVLNVDAMEQRYDGVGAQWKRSRLVQMNAADIPANEYIDTTAAVLYSGNGSDARKVAGAINNFAIGQGHAAYALSSNYNYDSLTTNWVADRAIAPADALAAPTFAKQVYAINAGYNGSTYDLLRVDPNKELRTISGAPSASDSSSWSPSTYTTASTTAAGVIKASAGRLLSLVAFDSDLDGWLQLFNKATTPANGDTAIFQFAFDVVDTEPLSKRAQWGREFFSQMGVYFSAGISWAWSTSANTLTTATLGAVATLNATYV